MQVLLEKGANVHAVTYLDHKRTALQIAITRIDRKQWNESSNYQTQVKQSLRLLRMYGSRFWDKDELGNTAYDLAQQVLGEELETFLKELDIENSGLFCRLRALVGKADIDDSDVTFLQTLTRFHLTANIEHGAQLIHCAVRHKNIQLTDNLLKLDCSLINQADNQGRIVLHDVAASTNRELFNVVFVHYLRSYKVDSNDDGFNKQDADGNTPVHLLCLSHQVDSSLIQLLEWLHRLGASFFTPNKEGQAPLRLLISKCENNEVGESLLNFVQRIQHIPESLAIELLADLDKRLASMSGQHSKFPLWHSLESSIKTSLDQGRRLLDAAATIKDSNEIELCLDEPQASLRVLNSHSMNAAHVAACYGNDVLIQALLAKEENTFLLTERAGGGYTILHHALVNHHYQLAERILSACISTNQRKHLAQLKTDESCGSHVPLFYAVQQYVSDHKRNTPALLRLLNRFPELAEIDADESKEIFRLILTHKLFALSPVILRHVYQIDDEFLKYHIKDLTTLNMNDDANKLQVQHMFYAFLSLEAEGILSETQMNLIGKTLREKNRVQYGEFVSMRSNFQTVITRFLTACAEGNLPEVEALLRMGVSPYLIGNYDCTGLHNAAHHGHTEVLTYLADRYPPLLSRRSGGGWTALHQAAAGRHTEALEYLLSEMSHSAECINSLVTMGNISACTILHLVIRRYVASNNPALKSLTDTITLLLEHDANPHILDSTGKDAVTLVKEYKLPQEVISLFEEKIKDDESQDKNESSNQAETKKMTSKGYASPFNYAAMFGSSKHTTGSNNNRSQIEVEIGPRELTDWTIKDVEADGNCFYYALIDQLINCQHGFMRENMNGRAPHDELRKRIQGDHHCDFEWAEDKDFEPVVKTLDVILAVVDTRYPQMGFQYYFMNNQGCFVIDVDGKHELPDKPVIKIAATGNHYMSVLEHPDIQKNLGEDENANDSCMKERISQSFFYHNSNGMIPDKTKRTTRLQVNLAPVFMQSP